MSRNAFLCPPRPVLVGRDAELAQLVGCLTAGGTTGRVVFLSGPPGSGKSSLARAAGDQIARHRPADAPRLQRFSCDLQSGGPLTAPDLLARAIHALDPQALLPDDCQDLQQIWRETAAGCEGILQFERATEAEPLLPFISPPPGWRVLITTETSLALPQVERIVLAPLSSSSAATILAQPTSLGFSAGRLQPVSLPQRNDFATGVANERDGSFLNFRDDLRRPALAALVAACGGQPLALRIAGAALADGMPVAQLAATGPNRPDDVIGAALAWWQLVLPQLLDRWRTLCVCPAPFDSVAALAIWGSPNAAEQTAGDNGCGGEWPAPQIPSLTPLAAARWTLTELALRRLVDYDLTAREWRIHPALRQRVLADLHRPVSDAARIRHAEHYYRLAQAADDRLEAAGDDTPEASAALTAFDALWPHLSAAWTWLRQRTDALSLRWLSELPAFIPHMVTLRLPPARRTAFLEAALTAARARGEHYLAAVHLGNLGLAYLHLGKPRRASECFREQICFARDMDGDACCGRGRRLEANALCNLALASGDLGQPAAMIACYGQALPILRELGDRHGEAAALANLALAYQAQEMDGLAVVLLNESLMLFEALHAPEACAVAETLQELRLTGRM